jgi:cell division protein ZapA (FtsZ GTPase activity inhibitor)
MQTVWEVSACPVAGVVQLTVVTAINISRCLAATSEPRCFHTKASIVTLTL